MGKITEVYYTDIPTGLCSVEEASRFTFLSNLIGVHPSFDQEYENYEVSQMKIKGRLIGDAIRRGEIKEPNLSSMIFGLSTTYERAILIIDL